MDLFEFLDEVTDLTDTFIGTTTQVKPGLLGLDDRCGKLYITPDSISVSKFSDRALQYYGGFEYIRSEYRHEIGDYVIYSAEDHRVRDCLEQYLNYMDEVDNV